MVSLSSNKAKIESKYRSCIDQVKQFYLCTRWIYIDEQNKCHSHSTGNVYKSIVNYVPTRAKILANIACIPSVTTLHLATSVNSWIQSNELDNLRRKRNMHGSHLFTVSSHKSVASFVTDKLMAFNTNVSRLFDCKWSAWNCYMRQLKDEWQ